MMPTMFSIISRLWNSDSDILYWRLQFILSLLVGATFVIGFWTVRVGSRANRRQADEISGLNRGTEDLKKANIAAQRDLEAERIKRLNIEKSLEPRQILLIQGLGKSNTDPLKPFAGTQMIVRFLPEAEPERAAVNIVDLAQVAGWKLMSVDRRSDFNTGFWDGVVVEPYAALNPLSKQSREDRADEERSHAAADALADFLCSNGWSARMYRGAKRGEIPKDSVIINVGFKTSPYFEQKRTEQIDEIRRKFEEELKKHE